MGGTIRKQVIAGEPIVKKPRTISVRAFGIAAALAGAVAQSLAASDPYARVVDADDGAVTLEMCTRSFEPVGDDAPRIHLVSAIHIADASYYAAMQRTLESYDTVLFEGVKPAGLDPIDPDLPDEAKAEATRERIGLLLEIADRHHARTGELPRELGDLKESEDPRIAAVVGSIEDDGWGNSFILMHTQVTMMGDETQTLTVISRGADGQMDGQGFNADIEIESEPYTPGRAPSESSEGIQAQLAKALRVAFQLDEMDTTDPGWVNADMDINQLQRALAEHGGDSGMILTMLEGESFSAKVVGFVLGFVARSPQLSSMMKLVLIDMLAAAEESGILEQQEAINAVIVEGRNAVVIDYLEKELAAHPEHDDIAIFYGAGHMSGLEKSIVDMGYRVKSNTWTPAMTVDIAETGLTKGQVRMMRTMIKSSLEQQFNQ